MEENNERTLKEQLNEIEQYVKSGKSKKKEKPFRLPYKGNVSRAGLAKGYVIVLEIGENGAVDFRKEPIVDGTIKLKETYHAVDSEDVLIYKGKPFVIIPKKLKFPFNPNRGTRNETYGQKHIRSRMLNETIKSAKSLGLGVGIGALIIGGIILYALFTG